MRMKLRLIDREVTSVDTREGRLTLWALFVPLFIEQLLMNLMGTVNTLVLGHYSDEAVAAVGAANQVVSLVFTFYAVISVDRDQPPAGSGKEKGSIRRSVYLPVLFGGAEPCVQPCAGSVCTAADEAAESAGGSAFDGGKIFSDRHRLFGNAGRYFGGVSDP